MAPKRRSAASKEHVPTSRYDHVFRLLVVARLLRGDLTAKSLAKSLGLSPWVVYEWRRRFESEAAALFPNPISTANENNRLRTAVLGFVSAFELLKEVAANTSASDAAPLPATSNVATEHLGQLRLNQMFTYEELARLLQGGPQKTD